MLKYFFSKLSLKAKLFIPFLLIGVIPVLVVGVVSFYKSKSFIEDTTIAELTATTSMKKNQVLEFYNKRRSDIHVLSKMASITSAFEELGEATEMAIGAGLSGNKILEHGTYKYVHDKYDSGFLNYITEYGYQDIYLLTAEKGQVIYSVKKGKDFGKFVSEIDSGLKDVWQQAKSHNDIEISDIGLYAPADNIPAQFLAVPVKVNNQILGILAFSIGLNHIGKIMTVSKSAVDSYLVGKDYLMRSDSIVDGEHRTVSASLNNPDLGAMKTEAATEALSGVSDTRITRGNNGKKVLASFDHINISDEISWAIVSKIDVDEAFILVIELRNWVAILVIIIMLIALILGIFFGTRVSTPILEIVVSLKKTATQLTKSAEQFSNTSQQLFQSSTNQASSIEETSSSIEEITGMISNNAERSHYCVGLVKSMNESSDKGNASMGDLIERMNAISASNEKIQDLVQVIGEIGEKTAIIDEIVFQTKLLSFNASVEAERAGEHGRGFAVVAQEVGNLADMSGKAAAEISSIVKESVVKAESITNENKEKVNEGNVLVRDFATILEEISRQAKEVLDSVDSIMSASNEQATGISQISSAIGSIDKMTQENVTIASSSADSGTRLNHQAESLNRIVIELTKIVRGSQTT